MDPVTTTGQEPIASGLTPVVDTPKPAEGQAPPAAKTFDEAYVKELRAEAAKNRKEKDALEVRLKAIEDAQLTEQEKAQKRLQELEAKEVQWQTERTELLTRRALEDAAREAGMSKARAIWSLGDRSDLKYDDEGHPTEKSLAAVVASVKADYPELFGQGGMPQSGRPTNGAGGPGTTPFDPKNKWAGVNFKD